MQPKHQNDFHKEKKKSPSWIKNKARGQYPEFLDD